jgi:hypothetical protein
MSKHPNSARWQAVLPPPPTRQSTPYLFFNFPFGSTDVIGATGRLEVPAVSGGRLVSFLGFFAILLLFWSPLAMVCS